MADALKSTRPSVVVAHPYWGRGGAEAAAMWTIAALVDDFDVTVYTRGGFDPGALNVLAGTDLDKSKLRVRLHSSAIRLPLGSLAHGAYLGSLKRIGAEYDLRVTASGVMHWGMPAIHFISSVAWNDALAEKMDAPTAPGRRGLRQRVSAGIVAAMSGEGARHLRADIFVANSFWTKLQSAPFCPGRLEVIHPPVPAQEIGLPWAEREDAVLVFGRLSPEKRIESCIRIVEEARRRGSRARLVIAGPSGDPQYAAYVSSLCRAHGGWVELLPAQAAEAKRKLLGRMRYGLSACRIEAFGIATAEMTDAGMLVLAPAGCGQAEIVSAPELQYDDESTAVARLLALQSDPALQRDLQERAAGAMSRFTPTSYMARVRRLALDTLAGMKSDGGVPG